jgi:hypothetical protein
LIKDGIDDQDVTLDLSTLAEQVEAGDLSSMPSKVHLLGHGENEGLAAKLQRLQRGHARRVGDFRCKVQERYDTVLEKLRAQGVNPDERQLARLTTQEAKAKDQSAEAKSEEALLAGLQRQRKRLLSDYRSAQEARFQERQRAMRGLTRELNEAIDEFKVKLSFRRGESYTEYEDWLRRAIINRFFRADRVASFCRRVHPIELADMVAKHHCTKLRALRDDADQPFLDGAEADEFITMISNAGLSELEAIDVSDAPAITLTTTAPGERPRPVNFGKLSFGQKAITMGAYLLGNRM